MKDFFKRSGYMSLLSSFLFLLLGILLTISPEKTVGFLSYTIGGVFLLMGIFKLITYFINKNKYMYYDYIPVIAILCLIIGIIITILGSTIVSMFGIAIGIWIIVNGITKIDLSIKMKDSNVKYWFLSLIISILILVVGIYILFVPSSLLTTLRNSSYYLFCNGYNRKYYVCNKYKQIF